jgi:hypothetical protein
MIKIFVSRAGMSHRLRLRDEHNDPGNADLTTLAGPGDIIKWELDPNAMGDNPAPGFFPIHSIVNIKMSLPANGPEYANSVDLLDGDPQPGPNGTFIGTVKEPSVGPGSFCNYMISFMLPGDTNVHIQDPRIQLNS